MHLKRVLCFVTAFFVLISCLPHLTLAATKEPPSPFTIKGLKVSRESYYPEYSCTYSFEKDGKKEERYFYGEFWRLAHEWDDEKKGNELLLKTLKERGAETLRDKDGKRLSVISEDENNELWVFTTSYSSECEMNVQRVTRIKVGDKLELDFNKDSLTTSHFYFDHSGKDFVALEVNIGDVDVTIEIDYKLTLGRLSRSINWFRRLETNHGSLHLCADIPQVAGLLHFKVHPHFSTGKKTVSIRMVKQAQLRANDSGIEIGGLQVRSVPCENIEVLPEFKDRHCNPLFTAKSLIADRQPNGDALFWLPPGLWTVRLKGKQCPFLMHADTHLVAVKANKITLLDIPKSLGPVFSPAVNGRLELREPELIDKERAKIQVSLVGVKDRNIVPIAEKMTVLEGIDPGRVTKVTQLPHPLELILLLDSSGSMKGSMRQALDATKQFVEMIPSDAKITVVDFDTKPKILPNTNRKTILTALKKVRANGATALYDSIILGLNRLTAKKRPALVVFTDGVDANWNDTKPGSKATKSEVFSKVKSANVPIFTIGYGKRPDVDTLSRVATLTGGSYYSAKDKESLNKVFASIKENLGKQYLVEYERPKKPKNSNVPVVSIVVDNSGSMDNAPTIAGCDYRIEKVRQILSRFVQSLPEGQLMQLLTFSYHAQSSQMLTDNKAEMLRSISLMTGDGGTNILDAVESSYETLKHIPSSKKMLVFLADAALKVPKEKQSYFDTLLGKIKDENINSLWLGIVEKDEGGAYSRAAVKSGGNKVIGTDLSKLSSLFQRLSQKTIAAQRPKGTSVRMTLTHRSAAGKNTVLSGSINTDFSMNIDEERVKSPEAVSWQYGPSLQVFDSKLSNLISGDDKLAKDVRISKRIPMEMKGRNEAVELKVHEAIFLTRLRGVEAPRDKRFLALPTSLTNVFKEQKVAVYEDGSAHPASWMASGAAAKKFVFARPKYIIPDLTRHIFLRWNNEVSCPTSEATWLAAKPLMLPRERAVSVAPDAPITGTLVFLVPEEQMEQLSLHLFDTGYGHVDIPLVGTMDTKREAYGKLPQAVSGALSSTFDFSLEAFEDLPSINERKAGSEKTFRVVEGQITSKVQAHLALSPKERISMALHTHLGDLLLPPSSVTEQLPLGFYRSSMFTPGSKNVIRLAFELPQVLAKSGNKGRILVDLSDQMLTLPLSPQPENKYSLKDPLVKGKGVSIWVHKIGLSGDTVHAEITLADEKDENHTSLSNLFILQGKTSSVTPIETDLLFGLCENDYVMDGQFRRGLLTFKIPSGSDGWRLQSPIFPGLDLPCDNNKEYANKVLLLTKLPESNGDGNYEKALKKALKKLTKHREATSFKKPGTTKAPTIIPGSKGEPKQSVPVPQMASIGNETLSSLKSHEELLNLLRNQDCVIDKDSIWRGRYSPEAVLTQGWGTVADLTALAQSALNRLGIESQCINVPLSVKGKEKYPHYRQLPGLLYALEGEEWILVIPEMKERKEISDLLDYKHEREKGTLEALQATIELYLHLERRKSVKNASKADAASALTGGGGNQNQSKKCLLKINAPMTELSLGTVDIGYTETKKDGRTQLKAVFEGAKGRQLSKDDEAFFSDEWKVLGEEIRVYSRDQETLRRYWPLAETDEITARFHSLAINLPELREEGVAKLQSLRNAGHKEAKNPDGLSALRWYTRGLLARFIGAQTAFENNLAKRLSLETGRVEQLRTICVTISRQDGKEVNCEIDLMNVKQEIHKGEEMAKRAFNIISGMIAARLEAKILEKGVGAFHIWEKAGLKDSRDFITTTRYHRDEFLKEMKKREFPEHIIKALEKSRKTVLFPVRPAMIKGKPRWAWLEVDPQSFVTESVLDNGARGAILDDIIANMLVDELQYIVGRMKGVEASVWAVSAFSLKLDDYEEIKKEAQAFLKGVAKGFSYDGPGTSTSTKPGADNNVKLSLGVGSSSYGEVGPVKFNFLGNPVSVKPHDSVAGFNNGFKDGVDYYFKKVAE